jgi:hypothetical protein
MRSAGMSFEVRKSCLRENCAQHGKLLALDDLGDNVLKMLWERGIEPAVQAVGDHEAKVAWTYPKGASLSG